MPVVNCLKAPGGGALGNRLWKLFSAPLPLTAPDPEAVPLRSCHIKSLWQNAALLSDPRAPTHPL